MSRGFVKFFIIISSSFCTKIFCSNRLLRKLRPAHLFTGQRLMGVDNRLAVFAQTDTDNRLCVCAQKETKTRGVYFGKKIFSFRVFVFVWAKQSWSSFLVSEYGKNKKRKPFSRFPFNFVNARMLAPRHYLLREHL